MRKIFIDCGGHTGSSVRNFCNTRLDWQDYEIYSFEPDPQHWDKWPIKIDLPLVKSFYNSNLNPTTYKEFNLIKKAVWIENCEKDFYITKADFRPEGGSTLDKIKHNHNFEKYRDRSGYCFPELKVSCIDIDEFIIEKCKNADYVIMKLDVEGAEYDIIPHMIAKNTFEFINEFYIEWHNWRSGRCPRPLDVRNYKSQEDLNFEKIIKEHYNLECKFWDAIDI